MKIYSSIYSEKISDVSDEELHKARHGVEFLMTQFPELEDLSRQIKERSSEENVVNVALNQIESDRWIKQYGDVLFKVIVAQSKYIKLL
jgi:hypothetical protein